MQEEEDIPFNGNLPVCVKKRSVVLPYPAFPSKESITQTF